MGMVVGHRRKKRRSWSARPWASRLEPLFLFIVSDKNEVDVHLAEHSGHGEGLQVH